ncbi:Metalloenzyme, LuxS/M16 peptidase-like protein [Hyaloraphidium curvatum]|nr:Metalloenzyme, LuxS/M16 peptidase-like protein [Hyaloraphidium curvatum]
MLDAFKYTGSAGDVHSFELLANGLRVLVCEDHSAPVATFMVTYKVGSRNEASGYTGSTHLLEHILFKGSENFNKENGRPVFSVLQNLGAVMNATTSLDRTNYFAMLPVESVDVAAEIEADRMRGAFIRAQDKEDEMPVVRNEFEKNENDPMRLVMKALYATAYHAHAYHCTTIGWKADIEQAPIEKLKEFYNTFYHPNNAFAIIVGDLDVPTALSIVEKRFSRIARSPNPIPQPYTAEPAQEGPRRAVIRRPGALTLLCIAHKTPHALHPDSPALNLLSSILSTGKLSRMYRRLVDAAKCTKAFANNTTHRDGGLFQVLAYLTPGTSLEEVEAAVIDELEKVKKDGVTADELANAKAQLKAELAFMKDGTLTVATLLNDAIAAGDWKMYIELPEKSDKVTAVDIKRVAAKYFDEDWRTTVTFIPKKDKDPNVGVDNSETIPDLDGKDNIANPGPSPVAPGTGTPTKPTRSKLASRIVQLEPVPGCTLYAVKTPAAGMIKIVGFLSGGEKLGKPMVAPAFATMLQEGTLKRTKFEVGELLESKGASLSFDSGIDSFRTRFTARCLTPDLGMILSLLGEMLREPRLNAGDFARVKKRMVAAVGQAKESPASVASQRLLQELFPPEHPNYAKPFDEVVADLEAVTADDLKAFQAQLGLGNFFIAIVGDVDPEAAAKGLKESLGGWKMSDFVIPKQAVRAHPAERKVINIPMPGKTSAVLSIGQSSEVDRDHPDFLPLLLATFELGGNFCSRLMQTVRDKYSLTYTITSNLSWAENGLDGVIISSGTFAPNLLARGIEVTEEQIALWAEDGLTEEQLELKKKTIIGNQVVSLGKCEGIANAILNTVRRGQPLTYIDDFPSIVNAVTLDDVRRAMKAHIHADRMVRIAAGPVEAAPPEKSLSRSDSKDRPQCLVGKDDEDEGEGEKKE